MAPRRRGLSQRRKAVGFTQESLAEHLGVERSTIVRWEAGDTEPLPSIRPALARALRVSIDQLAKLLTTSESADPTPAPAASAAPSRVPLAAPLVCADLGLPVADADPPAAITLGAARSGPPTNSAHPADTDTTDVGPDTPVLATVGAGVSAGSEVREPAQTEVPHGPSRPVIALDVEPADVPWRGARAWRFKRFAAAGVLALAGGAAFVLLVTSHSGSVPSATAATPAPDPANSNDNNLRSEASAEAVRTTPGAAPSTPADGLAPPAPTAVPAPHTDRATSTNRTTSRSKPRAARRTPPPRTPEIPAEAYVWPGIPGLSPSDRRGTRLRPEFPPWP